MKYVPRVYQERMIREMVEDPFHGGFAEPGLGKTSATLAALLEADALPALVVAPLRVCYSTWPDEVEKWDEFRDLKVVVLHGKNKGAALREKADIYLINPEGLPWLFGKPDRARKKWTPGRWQNWGGRPATLVVDESTKFKRSSSQRSKTLRRFLSDFSRRHILTGTPVPNGMLDLHGQILLLDEGEALTKYITHYQKRYFRPIPIPGRQYRVKWEILDGAHEEILEAISPRVTVLRAADWLDMPELVVTKVPIILPDRARERYDEMRKHGCILDWDLLVDEDAALNKCRQIANGAMYLSDGSTEWMHSAKEDALMELLEQIGAPTMVIYEFRHDLARIERALAGRRVGVIGGGVSAADGAKIASDWNAGKLDVLLIHPQSGGIGLNLQHGGAHQVWYGPPWNLEHYLQTVGRLHRQGQTRPVFVYHLVAKNTIDEQVARVLEAKGATQDDMMDALKEEPPDA